MSWSQLRVGADNLGEFFRYRRVVLTIWHRSYDVVWAVEVSASLGIHLFVFCGTAQFLQCSSCAAVPALALLLCWIKLPLIYNLP